MYFKIITQNRFKIAFNDFLKGWSHKSLIYVAYFEFFYKDPLHLQRTSTILFSSQKQISYCCNIMILRE